jgi:DUF1365 family protein
MIHFDTGGATHHFTYPLFFSFIDLEQISQIGWSLWPIFKLNGGKNSFCSLDEKDHLKDWIKEENDQMNNTSISGNITSETNKNAPSGKVEKQNQSNKNDNDTSLYSKVLAFINNRTKGTKKLTPGGSVRLLTHLTYFGYCFNPISIIYCLHPEKKKNEKNEKIDDISVHLNDTKEETNIKSNIDDSMINSVVVEVSNTPWIEMNTYMLDESVENVRLYIYRYMCLLCMYSIIYIYIYIYT